MDRCSFLHHRALWGPCWSFPLVRSHDHNRRSIYLTIGIGRRSGWQQLNNSIVWNMSWVVLANKVDSEPQTRGDVDVAPSKVSFCSSHFGWSWLIRRSRTLTVMLNNSLTLKSLRTRRISTLYALPVSSSRSFQLWRASSTTHTLCSSVTTDFHPGREVQLDDLRRLWSVSRKWCVQYEGANSCISSPS